MPAGEARPPRRVPDHLAPLPGPLPQRPVRVKALGVVNVFQPMPGFQIGQSIAAQFPVAGEGPGVEEHGAVGTHVGMPSGDQGADQVDHQLDGVAGPRVLVGRQDVQRVF